MNPSAADIIRPAADIPGAVVALWESGEDPWQVVIVTLDVLSGETAELVVAEFDDDGSGRNADACHLAAILADGTGFEFLGTDDDRRSTIIGWANSVMAEVTS